MSTKIKLAVLGIGPISLAGYYLFSKSSSNSLTKENYCQDSLSLLEGYKPAMEYLGGGPVKIENFDEKDPFNQIDKNNVKVKFPVKGKNRAADLIVMATRGDADRNWVVQQLEIKYHGKGARYRFFDRNLIKNVDNGEK